MTDPGANRPLSRTRSSALASLGRRRRRLRCLWQPDDINGENSSTAITHDLGHNIDQDGSCDLTGATDFPSQDPDLAPIFDNGGPRSDAGTAGRQPGPRRSRQLGLPGDGCPRDRPPQPERAIATSARSRRCSIGPPDASTGDAANVTDTSARPVSHDQPRRRGRGLPFRVRNVPGRAHVIARPRPPPAWSRRHARDRDALGPQPRHHLLLRRGGRQRDRFHDSRPTSSSSRPMPARRCISNVNVDSVTDTTATIDFTVDPQGADTTLLRRVRARHELRPADATQPSTSARPPGAQNLSVTLTDLDPASTYHFDVVASNGVQQTSTAATTSSRPTSRSPAQPAAR